MPKRCKIRCDSSAGKGKVPLIYWYPMVILRLMIAEYRYAKQAELASQTIVGDITPMPYNQASTEQLTAGRQPMRYAEVALNVPVHKTFTYHIPDRAR